jgi:GT2 family glycosyltransferase
MSGPDITVSIVSHRQNALVNRLLADMNRHCADRVTLILTENASDPVRLETQQCACPSQVVVNRMPKGFGANHNAAFQLCRSPFFCVANPDIRLDSDPFPQLLRQFTKNEVGVVGPLVRGPSGNVEDSARRFPTFGVLAYRFFRTGLRPDYPTDRGAVEVDWVAGMLMLFSAQAYRDVGGFDEAYFMYFEDADICRRLKAAGKSVIYDPAAEVVHEARRASRKNPRLALHHIVSAIRFVSGR